VVARQARVRVAGVEARPAVRRVAQQHLTPIFPAACPHCHPRRSDTKSEYLTLLNQGKYIHNTHTAHWNLKLSLYLVRRYTFFIEIHRRPPGAAMITYLATPPHLTAPSRTRRPSWKAFLRRVFEMAGAPYADGPYRPL
jgi:hypothetical protein